MVLENSVPVTVKYDGPMDGARPGEVEMLSWFNDCDNSSCSGCLRLRVEDCRRSDREGRDDDAMRPSI